MIFFFLYRNADKFYKNIVVFCTGSKGPSPREGRGNDFYLGYKGYRHRASWNGRNTAKVAGERETKWERWTNRIQGIRNVSDCV